MPHAPIAQKIANFKFGSKWPGDLESDEREVACKSHSNITNVINFLNLIFGIAIVCQTFSL